MKTKRLLAVAILALGLTLIRVGSAMACTSLFDCVPGQLCVNGNCVTSSPPVNLPPQNISATVNVPFSYSIQAPNNPTSFSASPFGLQPWLSLNSFTGLLTGTPPSVGNFSVLFTANYADGSTANGTVIITVNSVPQPPVISDPGDLGAQVGVQFDFQIIATNATSYGATGLPPELSIDTSQGLISGTPLAAGTYHVTLTATNSAGVSSVTRDLTVIPASAPLPPVILDPGEVAQQLGLPFTFTIVALNHPTSFSATGLPSGVGINSNGEISGTATALGTSTVTVTATNAGGTNSLVFTLIIIPLPPSMTSPRRVAGQVGVAFNFQITATNNPTGFYLSSIPQGLALNNTTGLISGTPTLSANGTVTLTLMNDGGGANAPLSFTIYPPGLTQPILSPLSDQTLIPGQLLALSVLATVGDRETLTFQVNGQPANATFYSIGDVSERAGLSANDGTAILQAAVGTRTLTDDQKILADVTGNGLISAKDASDMLRIVAGLDKSLNHYFFFWRPTLADVGSVVPVSFTVTHPTSGLKDTASITVIVNPLPPGGVITGAGPFDINKDGVIDQVDVQLSNDQAVGAMPCTADFNHDGICSVLDTQQLINLVPGGH